jgi:hypothetical protein
VYLCILKNGCEEVKHPLYDRKELKEAVKTIFFIKVELSQTRFKNLRLIYISPQGQILLSRRIFFVVK